MCAQGLLAQAKQHPDKEADLLAVLRRIPHNLRAMYVHAYQSWLWNAAASARVAAHGLTQPVAGDLVLPIGDCLAEDADGRGTTACRGSATGSIHGCSIGS